MHAGEGVDCRGSRQLGRIQACLTYRLCPCLRSGEASPAAGSPEALARLANGAPCPYTDYQPLLAHRAHFTHCLQEPPPGNLYLQGWQTAISSITGWLRETEPIKWVLDSLGGFHLCSKQRRKRKKERKCLQCLMCCTFRGKKCTCYANTYCFPKDARANRKRHG